MRPRAMSCTGSRLRRGMRETGNSQVQVRLYIHEVRPHRHERNPRLRQMPRLGKENGQEMRSRKIRMRTQEG